MSQDNLDQILSQNKIRFIDLKYIDLMGKGHHIAFPVRRLSHVMENGIPFDGSSVPGMKCVEAGDMILLPDPASATIDPFSKMMTVRMLCSICDANDRMRVTKDSRNLSFRAHDYMIKSGIADESLWLAEFEFYLFDKASIRNSKYTAGFEFVSEEGGECMPIGCFYDTGVSARHSRKGYHLDTPFDKYSNIRAEIVALIEEAGCPIRYHHHEVGMPGQQEIETEMLPFTQIIDKMMYIKDIIHNHALQSGLSVTFMPKPIFDEPGNGLHFHIQLRKNGRNLFFHKGNYADLSPEALCFVGGILKHGRSLAAFTNPSTNSYKRLIPGFEAPVKLFFGLANRSAAIRIPRYTTTEESKRIEYRSSDATCNYYLGMSAILMAGLDGINNQITPTMQNGMGPIDQNVLALSEDERNRIASMPKSLDEALEALSEDHDYLLYGNVFTTELIESWVDEKTKEINSVQNRPHPFEMNLYYAF